ncbi:related to putative tartrate transporter [Phialocephala subalpina]|uniref:Related to putative tartrate transporter n=1 Tax=Phialocephala subalpina TaxID=576137 RepID=A0A1L7XPI2_9HELO|nr:related to putative tartrate transporter [Phialocephala subalpina]
MASVEKMNGTQYPIDTKEAAGSDFDVERGPGTAQELGENYVVDRALEKRLLWKFDLHILPMLAIMYLFNSIDKSNLGNAKTDGMTKDLHFKGNQYNILLSIFYVPLVLSAVPMNMMTKKFGAKFILPIAMMIFGSMAMISASAKNFGGIVTTRWFLGMAESGFYPGVIFYLTTFYKRNELAGRLSIFYAASEVAGAFTGLIAFGVFQIKSGSLFGWQYLFLIEGGLTVLGGIVAILVLPKSAATAYFLSEEEKALAYHRIAANSSTVVDSEFSFRDAISVFAKDRLWPIYMAIGFCVGVPLFSVSNFLPQIIAQLGYSTVKTNLYTVAPNVVGAFCVVCVAFSSDYWGDRSIHLAATLGTTAIGFVVLACVDVPNHLHVGYFACFLLCAGGFITSPLLSTWYNNNTPDENQRAILTPVLVASANAMGLVAANIFTEKSAPRYLMASIICACFGFAGVAITLGLGFWMKFDNARRNKAQGVNTKAGDVPTSQLIGGQKDPSWRWMGGVP